MSHSKYSLSIFFPCFNDSETIAGLVRGATTVARDLVDDHEIIVIDDGSTDSSREILLRLQDELPELSLVFHETNGGYGAALRSGFEAATKDLIFYTDGDGQYDVLDLSTLFPLMQNGIDVVNGYKISRNDPLHRVVIGKFFNQFIRLLFNIQIRDVSCDFRLLRKSIFDEIQINHSSGIVCLELVKKLEMAGFQIAEAPVPHYDRVFGKSQFFNVPNVIATARGLCQLWYQLVFCNQSPSEADHNTYTNASK